MLKRRALVLFVVLLMVAMPVIAAAAAHVEFEDDNLAAAVVQEFANLGSVRERSKIDRNDMKLLEKLYAFGPAVNGDASPFWWGGTALPGADVDELIRDLTGLEYALNLEALDVSFNTIKDLTPIRNLEKLGYLNIRGNDNGIYTWTWNDTENVYIPNGDAGTPSFSYNPSSPQMKILQDIQHQGAVVDHDGLVKRISGPNRYETAIRVWQNMYTVGFVYENENEGWVMDYNPGNTIVLARGDDYADALVGAPLASQLGAPVLLTTSNKLHPATKSALVDYIEKFEDELTAAPFNGVFDVYVLGKEDAISEAVVDELRWAIETEYKALDVRAIRVGGADRYATSVEIAKKINALIGGENEWPEVIFASGETDRFGDALSAAPYAAAGGNADRTAPIPVLLTKGNALPASVTKYLKDLQYDIADAVVAGGSAAVSEKVIGQLNNLEYRLAGADQDVFGTVTRVWGADRYITSVELGKHYGLINVNAPNAGRITTANDDAQVLVATGADFADALTGAPLAAQMGTGILLVKKDTLPSDVEKAMNFQSNRARDNTAELTILGGEAAVSLSNAVKMYNLVRYPAWAPR